MNRRSALRIAAAMAGVPVSIAGVRAFAPGLRKQSWRGEVLGAPVSLDLWHGDEAFARAGLRKVRGEIERLERIFSLYRGDSEISRLNAAGRLKAPSRELPRLIEEGQRLGEISGGAFDISVQPLWALYEEKFWRQGQAETHDFPQNAERVARRLVGYGNIEAGRASIGFAKPGMAITLNSMAQGLITDRAIEILRNEGFETAVADLGEFRTLGRHPDGRPFRFEIPHAGLDNGDNPWIDLENMALAVSRGSGTVFEPGGRHHHIFDPRTGQSAHLLAQVAAIAPTATAADGLATAICAAGAERAPAMLSAYPNARAILTLPDGRRMTATAQGLAFA